MSKKLIRISIVASTLIAAAGCSHGPAAQQAAQAPVSACGEAYPVVDARKAMVVEGFGGPDAQLLVTKQRPQRRCGSPLLEVPETRTASLP